MRALVVGWTLVLASAAWASSEEEAGDVSEVDKDALGPLRERIPPVTGHVFLKEHRLEISPAFSVSLRDAFYTKYVVGGSVAYHLTETFALNGRFGYSIPAVSGAAVICNPAGSNAGTVGCSAPTLQRLEGSAPGAITLMGGLDVEWAPIYGKIALFSEYFAHIDFYGILGASFVQYIGPGPLPGPGQAPPPVSMSTGGGNVGVGLHLFLNRWLTLRGELRDLIYPETVAVPAPGSALRNQLFFELGFSLFFPTVFQEG